MKGPSPLLGYNTNVRHSGKLFHIQTEDSGLKHPHIITHLFADGGRIVASRKTTYAEHVGADDYQQVVKQLMRDQHKAMFIALRDGVYDEGAPSAESDPVEPTPAGPDIDSLETAASRVSKPEPLQSAPTSSGPGRYQVTTPADDTLSPAAPASGMDSIFGGDLLSEKSLDEVILSYLAEDLEEEPGA